MLSHLLLGSEAVDELVEDQLRIHGRDAADQNDKHPFHNLVLPPLAGLPNTDIARKLPNWSCNVSSGKTTWHWLLPAKLARHSRPVAGSAGITP